MNSIHLSHNFLKYGIFTVLAVSILAETLSWVYAYDTKLMIVDRNGGPLIYIGMLMGGLVLPELSTVAVLVLLINLVHRFFGIKTVGRTARSVIRYELHFLPVIALSYLVITPVSMTVRYLLLEFPDYTLAGYWNNYIVTSYSWDIYLRYLLPIVLITYVSINIALLRDYCRAAIKYRS